VLPDGAKKVSSLFGWLSFIASVAWFVLGLVDANARWLFLVSR
jgi:hypothetical protein